IAMRNIQPQVAGAASGMINTTRQLGGVIGSAAVGALLQNQLVTKLTDSAETNAKALPAEQQARFVDAFKSASSGSLEVGAGQSGASLPPNTPHAIVELALKTFHEGFTAAMKSTMVLPLIVLGVAALTVLFVRNNGKAVTPPAPAATGTVSPETTRVDS
ncbi:MAG: MFS transporter, partial [Catenulispora sp.]|nr:MFS transporter [Catenulispora sp.]